MKTKQLLIVTGKDRPGIIAEVTGILYRHHCNLEDVSMTILEGVFAMIVVVSFQAAKRAAIDLSCQALSKKWKLSFDWKPVKGLGRGARRAQQDLYLISAVGRDRTGIVYEISRALAKRGLNIHDLNSKILSGPKTVYAMILEVTIPKNFSVASLQKTLAQISRKLQIDITLKPVERLEF